MRQINKGVTAVLPFNVYNATGALVNATAAPTIKRIMVNGAVHDIAGVVIEQQQDATPANITGRYQAKVPSTTLNYNDQIQVQIEVEVDGVTLSDDLQFTVVNAPESRPRIDTI